MQILAVFILCFASANALLRARLEAPLGAPATGPLAGADAIADIVARQTFFLAERARLALPSVAGTIVAAISARAISAGAIAAETIARRAICTRSVSAGAIAARTIAATAIFPRNIAAAGTRTTTCGTIAARGTLIPREPGARRRLIHADLRWCRAWATPLAATWLPLACAGLSSIAAAARSRTARTLPWPLAAFLAFAGARAERRVFANAIERAQLACLVAVTRAPRLL